MATTKMTCRFRVHKPDDSRLVSDQLQDCDVLNLEDCPQVDIETRTKWANELVKHFKTGHDSIRPWDFLGELDGSLQLLPSTTPRGTIYPARFQIPPVTIVGLASDDMVRRAERFAMASLLYEIFSGHKPFLGLTDEEVQHRFSNADFPNDAVDLPSSAIIYSGWSEEFAEELNKRAKANKCLQVVKNYAQAHPILAGIQVAGLAVGAASLVAVPVLGVVGFTAMGPAAGSAAAAWQASIGAVEAGSLFAWCQSAAMGGAALGGIQIAGLAGATISMTSVPGLLETFKKNYRRGGEN